MMINFVEVLLYIALSVFAISTLYLISAAKKSNYELVSKSITNPLFPNLNFNFLAKLQDAYYASQKKKLPVWVNRISFYTTFIGFFLLFFLVIAQEMNRY